jgi:hypothetical protein
MNILAWPMQSSDNFWKEYAGGAYLSPEGVILPAWIYIRPEDIKPPKKHATPLQGGFQCLSAGVNSRHGIM